MNRIRERFCIWAWAQTAALCYPTLGNVSHYVREIDVPRDLRDRLERVRIRSAMQLGAVVLDSGATLYRMTNQVSGIRCTLLPVSLGRRIAAAFPRSQFVLVEKAMLFISIDQPAAVAASIAAFVNERITA